ncbi:contractile injection system protein, VgrG/Pvc8 family [Moraxella sp. ZY210820]|uniref:contractile injection system protein, VgrG/Pvc8 family n=1 Tax=unclassified Moraxella TaxID=2685852 RepID=UPI002731F6B6|nr:contractile injection system protein, VgrG/Pvc8 family [Moraxella sp. ZY210820]WLF84487.1 hypothetical protein LU301_03150 [Moraxella sp. ZY210820]
MLKTPVCILTVDNKPLNDVIVQRIISVSLTDNRAKEADQLDIVLDDHDGKLELPKRGVKINCQLGFKGEPLTDKGDFIVDEVEWAGTPDTITIKASSANLRGEIKSGKSQSFHRKTFGEIAQSIAKNNQLKLNMPSNLANIKIAHIDQTDESDLSFIQRLANRYGAEMAVKKDMLLIFVAGQGKTASGKTMPTLTITRKMGDQYRYNEEDSDGNYTGVTAYYYDKSQAKRKPVEKKKPKKTTDKKTSNKKTTPKTEQKKQDIKAKPAKPQVKERLGTRTKVIAGDVEHYGDGDDKRTKTKVLKGTFATKAEAEQAVQAKMAEKNRKMAKFSITTAFGIPDISTEQAVKLQGFKPQIDGLRWIVAKATHQYSTSGLTTQLELEASI